MAPSRPDGHFGQWTTDGQALPAYEYTCDQDQDPAAVAFTTQGLSRLHWHQIGNDHITAIATNRGEVQAIESSRGLQWLNRYDPARLCPGAGIGLVLEDDSSWTDLYQAGDRPSAYRRIFGAGYYRKLKAWDGLLVDHRIIAPFGDDPVLLSEIVITNTSDHSRQVSALEFVGVNLHYMEAKGIYATSARRHYGWFTLGEGTAKALARLGLSGLADVEQQRTRRMERFRFAPAYSAEGIATLTPVYSGPPRPPRERRGTTDDHPYPLFMASLIGREDLRFLNAESLLEGDGRFRAHPVTNSEGTSPIRYPCLCLGRRLTLAPGDSARMAYCFGYEQGCSAPEIVARYRGLASEAQDLLAQNGAAWQRHLVRFEPQAQDEDPSWIEREARWHAYYTRSAFLYDEYRRCHYTPQGGPYEFLHGLRGTVRDLALVLSAIIYLEPRLAAELLEYCFWKMTPTGRLIYATVGHGRETGLRVHDHPSDLQLFLLWALTEYLFFTGDEAFLDRAVPFYSDDERPSTIREKVHLALRYLYEDIGLGAHGLLRVSDGDWSDGITLFVPDRGRFIRHGESVFNSAMALYVLPRVADLVASWDPAEAAQARDYVTALRQAVLRCFNGRWFYRAYDGSGRPVGDQELFLEHHAWLLISRALPEEMARSVVTHVHDVLDRPSAFGQYVLYPPKRSLYNIYRRGWDVNGGIWFAMDFLLTWGYGCYDPQKAWAALRKNSCAHKATVKPDLWYGIWSGPDSFNADHAERPGETYFTLYTPSTDFPVMNLNWHAGFLSALLKLCGVEPTRGGMHIRPLLPFTDFALETPTFTLDVRGGQISFVRRS